MNRLKSNVNNALKKEVGTVLYAFHLGRARVICARELATKLNQPEVLIRQTIAEMRMEGQPIASTNRAPKGYYIPASISEAKECLDHLRSRVRKISMSAAGVERGLRARFGNQIELALFDDPHVKGGALL